MNKRVIFALLSLAMLPLFGCTLAQPDGTNEAYASYSDRLVGVMITTEYLDFFDMESWLQNNLDNIDESGELVLPEIGEDLRLYAKLSETGRRYEFECVDGILLAGYQIQPSDATHPYWATDCSEGLCDIATSTHALDDGVLRELSGTLYVERDYGDVIFYLNPIYQTADGSVYLIPGTGIHINSHQSGTAAQTLTQEITLTEDGQEQNFFSKIEIMFSSVQTSDTIVVLHISADNCVLRREEFAIDHLPDALVPSSDVAYLIVEEHSADGVSRFLYQRSDTSFSVFRSPDGMLCFRDSLEIWW